MVLEAVEEFFGHLYGANDAGTQQPTIGVWPIRELDPSRVERGDWAPILPTSNTVKWHFKRD